MLEGLRRRVGDRTGAIRRKLADLPRGLRVVGAIFLVLMWVLSVQYLAADVGIPLAKALGAASDGALAAAYLATFGVLLIAPFVILLDWEFGQTARSAGMILLFMGWFVAADRVADSAAASYGVPYVLTVVGLFLLPVFAVTVHRLHAMDDEPSCVKADQCMDSSERPE